MTREELLACRKAMRANGKAENADVVRQALQALPEELRELMQLRYIEYMDWEQINEIMHISHSTSVRMHKKALKILLNIT